MDIESNKGVVIMKVKVFQFAIKDGNVQENIDKVTSLFHSEKLSNTDVVVLPEMWTSGYDLPNIEEYADNNLEPTFGILADLAKQYDVNIVAGSVPNIKDNKRVYNTAFIINSQGKLVHEYSKMHLVPMLDEPEYLQAGNEPVETFKLNGENAGVAICYDLRFPELFRDLAMSGAKVIFVVAEWPIERTDHWLTLLKARAIEIQCYIVASNTVGTQTNQTTFAGHSIIIDPFGKVLYEASSDTENIISAELDLSYVDKIRKEIPIFNSRRKELYKNL